MREGVTGECCSDSASCLDPSHGTEMPGEGGETGGTRELATFPVCPWALEKSDLFPPQGDVFVTVDMLNSAGIQVVSKT